MYSILKKVKEMGIHTAVETSGYAKTADFERILPYTDLFLYDYKAETSLHKKLTGVKNGQILRNLKFLCQTGASVILRCPIVPGVNENDEALEEFVAGFPQIQAIERLAYHAIGESKARSIGLPARQIDRVSDEK